MMVRSSHMQNPCEIALYFINKKLIKKNDELFLSFLLVSHFLKKEYK